MRLRSLSISLVLLALLAASCDRRPEARCTGDRVELRQRGTLTVGTDFEFPPYSFRGEDGDVTGYDIELMRLLGRQMKLEVLFVNRGASALVPGVLAHRHDVAVSALRDTDELRGQACLSQPYLEADLAVLAPNPDPHAIEDVDGLDGRNVGVLDGGRAERWAAENLDAENVTRSETTDDLVTALKERRVEAIVHDAPIVRFAREESKDVRTATTIDTGESYVIASAPDNAALMRRIDAALTRLEESGALRKLERDWFGA